MYERKRAQREVSAVQNAQKPAHRYFILFSLPQIARDQTTVATKEALLLRFKRVFMRMQLEKRWVEKRAQRVVFFRDRVLVETC